MSAQVAKSFLLNVRWMVLALILLPLAVGAFVSSHVVNAGPSHEVEHQYFDGPDYGNQVGTKFIRCYGTHTFGQVTQWVVTIDGDYCC